MPLTALIVLLSALAAAHALAQDSPAAKLLPDAANLGSSWSTVSGVPKQEGRASSGTSWANMEYIGPNGARVLVTVYVVAAGPKAARDTWEIANRQFDVLRFSFDSAYGRERDLEEAPVVGGCADMRRVDGSEEVFSRIPVGLTLCAADPDILVIAYVSGEVRNLTGYAAADLLVELVLSRAGRPSPDSAPLGTPVIRAAPVSGAIEGYAPETGGTSPDRDVSAQTRPLLELLPTQDQVPAGLILVDEAKRSKEEVIAALGGTEESAQLLDDWGWSGNAFRDFIADDTAEPAGETIFLNVSVHRFADAKSAANAMVFFSDQVVFVHGLEEVEPPAIGESARLLRGAPDGVPLAVLYAQQGPIMYRIGGSTESPDGDPTADVLAVACRLVPSRGRGAAEPVASPAGPSADIRLLAPGRREATS
jgi:hypothetical protein